MKLASTLLLLLFTAALAGAGLYLLQTAGGGDGRGFRGGPVAVEVETARLHSFDDRIQSVGSVIASESVTMTARVSDTVQNVRFDDGDIVEEGDILVELTSAEEVAQHEEAEAILREAEQRLERDVELVQRGNATQARLDESRRLVAAARSRLAAADARLRDRVIRAPFDGVLGLRRVSPGTLVSPGEEITTLDDITPVRVDFAVPERFLSAIEEGQRIEVTAPAFPNETFQGVVRTISSRVDPVSRAVTVRAELPNEDKKLRPGMLMAVTLISNQRQAVGVAESALVPVGERQYLFIVDDQGLAERREVTLGTRRPGIAEIRSGVEVGEDVVTIGTLRLRDGASARIVRRNGEDMPDEPAAAGGQAS